MTKADIGDALRAVWQLERIHCNTCGWTSPAGIDGVRLRARFAAHITAAHHHVPYQRANAQLRLHLTDGRDIDLPLTRASFFEPWTTPPAAEDMFVGDMSLLTVDGSTIPIDYSPSTSMTVSRSTLLHIDSFDIDVTVEGEGS